MVKHNRPIYLATGGTGGHIFPAIALADNLSQQGVDIIFLVDKRAVAYRQHFETYSMKTLPAGTIYGGGVFRFIKLPLRIMTIMAAVLRALFIMLWRRPALVVGFGGYPSFAPVIAARLLFVPILVHEQNAVMGRVNRLLTRLGAYVALSFDDTQNVPTLSLKRISVTGNPVRKSVLDVTRGGYRFITKNRPFDLLIFGGSQSAEIFNHIVPKAIALLPDKQKDRLRITQQSHRHHIPALLEAYKKINVYVEIRDFFDDLPRRIRRAHLVVSRAGASTISELKVIGAPSILVPLPGSLDQDQSHNARDLAQQGAAWLMMQDSFTPGRLAGRLEDAMLHSDRLARMAACAASLGDKRAVEKISQLVLTLATRGQIEIDI